VKRKVDKYEKQITISLIFYNIFGVFLLAMDIIRRLDGIYTYSTEFVILLAIILSLLNANDRNMRTSLRNPWLKGLLILAIIISGISLILLIVG